jgi:hypothetical protein
MEAIAHLARGYVQLGHLEVVHALSDLQRVYWTSRNAHTVTLIIQDFACTTSHKKSSY